MLQISNGLNGTNVGTANAPLRYQDGFTHHFFYGDESAIEQFNAFKERALANNHEYFGVLELQPGKEMVLHTLKLLVDSVPPSPEAPAANAIQWMEDMHPNCWKAWQKAAFYLAGSASSVQQFKSYLLQKQVAARQIHTIVYQVEK